MFCTHPKTNFNFSVAFNLASADALNLDQSKILSFDKELIQRTRVAEQHTSKGECNTILSAYGIVLHTPSKFCGTVTSFDSTLAG